MRLLKVESGGNFSLVQLERDKMQPYAVLSHVWGETDQELTFKDIMDKTGKQKAGYEKIDFCAKQAEEDKIQYIWVDTCCIDKSSSAELSEAINSMYHWYENATKCYAYLSDVSYPERTSRGQGTPVDFPTSRWFERGWTLQELIAPQDVVFYSKEWRLIGTKSTLARDLQKITGIDGRVLEGAHPSLCSVADRMSWAAKRKTTREEDVAYSLLGIFDVNMPLLYGERGKAFIRLQEEIMKASDDQSVFAWTSSDSNFYAGLLATSPEYFDTSRSITSPGYSNGSEPSVMTSRGIRATFDLEWKYFEDGTHFARLACHRAEDSHQYAILLQHIQGYQYIRISPSILEAFDPQKQNVFSFPTIRKTVYVRQNLFSPLQLSRFPRSTNGRNDIRWFWFRSTGDLRLSELVASAVSLPDIALFGLGMQQTGTVLITYGASEDQKMSIHFGIHDNHPFCRLEDFDDVTEDISSWVESGLGMNDHRPIRKREGGAMANRAAYGESTTFMTARASQVKIRSFWCTVITLCLKTVG
jgi:hypothetical protein